MMTHSTATPAPTEAQNTAPTLAGFDQLGLVRRPGIRGWFRRHPKSTNAVVVGIYALLVLVNLPIALADMGHDAWWLLPGQLMIAVLLCFRNTWPLSVLIVIALTEVMLLIIYPWSGAQMVGVWFAAYCVGLHRGLVWGLLTSLPATLVGYISLLRLDHWLNRYGEGIWITDVYQVSYAEIQPVLFVVVISMCLTSAIFAGVGAAVRRGRTHEQEILDWAQRSHQLAQVGERNRIAREMHDVVAHSLSVMISLADGARVVGRKNPERAGEVLEELSSTGRSALADMRRVIGVLKKGADVIEARQPVRESLEELYEGFRQAGLPLKVTTTGPPLPEDAAFGLTVHRIVQESLTNVLRYGRQVTDVNVRIEHIAATEDEELQRLAQEGYSRKEAEALGLAGAAQVIITITDDGAHTGPENKRTSVGSGLGIQGMQERADFYSGSVYAGPGKYRGWSVRAVLEPPARSIDSSAIQRAQPGQGQIPTTQDLDGAGEI